MKIQNQDYQYNCGNVQQKERRTSHKKYSLSVEKCACIIGALGFVVVYLRDAGIL